MVSSMSVKRMATASMFLALGLLLPFLTGQIPEIGSRLSPMHIPVLLCGFVCGWPYGIAVGFITPLLRSMIFGMPPLMPTAMAMAFELAAYGFVAGLLYKRLAKKPLSVYVSLIVAMIVGRIVWGVVSVPLYMINGATFNFSIFLAGGFINAIPGMIVQIALIPLLVMALERAHLMPKS